MENLTERTLATERKYTGKIISVDLCLGAADNAGEGWKTLQNSGEL